MTFPSLGAFFLFFGKNEWGCQVLDQEQWKQFDQIMLTVPNDEQKHWYES